MIGFDRLRRLDDRKRAVALGSVAAVGVVVVVTCVALGLGPPSGPSRSDGPGSGGMTVPVVPEVVLGPPDASGACTATWTAPGGVTRFVVTVEAPAPPASDSVSLGPARRVARTTARSALVPVGSSVEVAVELGDHPVTTGPATAPRPCAAPALAGGTG